MMQSDRPDVPRKLLGGGAIKLRIALASALILSLGAWLAPPAAQSSLSAPLEQAAPLLGEEVQRREAGRTFAGVQDVAARVGDQSVAILPPPPPPRRSRTDFTPERSARPDAAGFGVFVADRYILTHEAALDGRSSVTASAGARTFEARLAVYEPATGLVLLQADTPALTPVTPTADVPVTGALTVGVGRSAAGDVAVPVFVTSVSQDQYMVGAAAGTLPPGLPIYTLTGDLFAVSVPEGGGGRALPARAAADRLLARVAAGDRRLALGLGVQAAADVGAPIFGDRGLVVTEVLDGGPADVAELQVGDVLLAMDGVALASVEAVASPPSSNVTGPTRQLRVSRAGRVLEVTLTPALAYDVTTLARGRDEVPRGLEARALFDTALLEQAAIPPAARVLAMNGRPVTSRAQAQREWRAARGPIPLLLRDDGDQYFVALGPAR